MGHNVILPAEWYLQSAVQFTWPHENTDRVPASDGVILCFVAIAREVIRREKLLVICPDETIVREQLDEVDYDRVIFREMDMNNTRARDHGGTPVFDEGTSMLYDFISNGWGVKSVASHDNLVTRNLCHMKTFSDRVIPTNMQLLVLEGGSIESDGEGALMAAAECLASVNRNECLQQEELKRYLKDIFGLDRIFWIISGYLIGDDTDSHVNTLVRFCSEDTIAYARCEDKEDEHYGELKAMKEEIKEFTRANDKLYCLVPLPMADKVGWEGKRSPTTYTNFLIMSEAVLVPFCDSLKDEAIKAALQEIFPDCEVIGISYPPPIEQRGPLHCITM